MDEITARRVAQIDPREIDRMAMGVRMGLDLASGLLHVALAEHQGKPDRAIKAFSEELDRYRRTASPTTEGEK